MGVKIGREWKREERRERMMKGGEEGRGSLGYTDLHEPDDARHDGGGKQVCPKHQRLCVHHHHLLCLSVPLFLQYPGLGKKNNKFSAHDGGKVLKSDSLKKIILNK